MGKNLIIVGADFAQNAVDGTDIETYYSISRSLTHCTLSNSATSVASGNGYTANVAASTGYTLSSVAVTMGGTDITSSVYANGVITIQAVTGNVTITAVATADASAGLFDNATWFNGYWNASGTSATTKSGTTYLTNYFIELPTDADWTITPKTISGYLVGIRPYVCRTMSGTSPQTFTRSSTVYGNVSSAAAQTLSTATIRQLDTSAAYFAVCLYANTSSGSGVGMTLTDASWDDLITVTKNS